MRTFADIQKMELKDLSAELEKARRDWLNAKLSVRMSQDKKSHLIAHNKRYVAQILTQINRLKKEKPQEKPTK